MSGGGKIRRLAEIYSKADDLEKKAASDFDGNPPAEVVHALAEMRARLALAMALILAEHITL